MKMIADINCKYIYINVLLKNQELSLILTINRHALRSSQKAEADAYNSLYTTRSASQSAVSWFIYKGKQQPQYKEGNLASHLFTLI